MNRQTLLTTYGCLLHDVGKVVCRAGAKGAADHSAAGAAFLTSLLTGPQAPQVLDCVGCHHPLALARAALPKGSIAYIACLADRIASADCRTAPDTADGPLPLSSVFTHMNGEHPGKYLPLHADSSALPMPVDSADADPAAYGRLLALMRQKLCDFSTERELIPFLLHWLEECAGRVPAHIPPDDAADVSLYDHLKISAAVGSCISQYLLANGITDYRAALLEQQDVFCRKPVFLLYSADFSGIQHFIYTVTTKNALRALRSRSFFLELLMEHYIDELLSGCGVSRANLLYSGGGHCYLLLPGTEAVQQTVSQWNQRFNDWLLEQFGTGLYLADGAVACSADDLTNSPAEQAPYQAMFRCVSSAVARRKVSRYSARQLMRLNRPAPDSGGRECRVCGKTEQLVPDPEDNTCVCRWCSTFETLSAKLLNNPIILVSEQKKAASDFSLPTLTGEVCFMLTDEAAAKACLETGNTVRRSYVKGEACAGLENSIWLYRGDYAAASSMTELAASSRGITRLGVCRMDVDNLGQAFVSGFARQEETDNVRRQRYVTLSRTAAFSRQMSLFFKSYINAILSGAAEKQEPLQVTLVYAGGDDVFLVGAWNDVIRAAQRIQSAFQAFTCDALTISGGICLFRDHHPIRLSAHETAELEDASKQLPGKNAITVFAAQQGHTYHWDVFARQVVGEKFQALERFFGGEQEEWGNSLLYKLTELLCDAQGTQANGQKKPLALARYAYLLSRLEPKADTPARALYRAFSEDMYRWALDETDRGQLITAIYLYVYQNRKGQ